MNLLQLTTRAGKIEHPVLVEVDQIDVIQPSIGVNRAKEPEGFDGTLIKLRHDPTPLWVITAYEDVRDMLAASAHGQSLEEYRRYDKLEIDQKVREMRASAR